MSQRLIETHQENESGLFGMRKMSAMILIKLHPISKMVVGNASNALKENIISKGSKRDQHLSFNDFLPKTLN